MDPIPYLHGIVGVLVLCGLLLLDEAGLPLPLAPSEILLIFAGLLVASAVIPMWIILPAAACTMTAGMLAGYSWARVLGNKGLGDLAEKVHASEAYHRASSRLASASPVTIFLARLVPGVRPYATLVSGAAEVPFSTFLLGALPALLLWELVLTGIGLLIGWPAARYLGAVERMAFQGGLLVVLGLGAYFGLRQAAEGVKVPARWIPPRFRVVLVLALDTGIVGCIVAGMILLARQIFGITGDTWIDIGVVVTAVAAYLALRPDRPRITVDGMFLR